MFSVVLEAVIAAVLLTVVAFGKAILLQPFAVVHFVDVVVVSNRCIVPESEQILHNLVRPSSLSISPS